MKKISLLVSVSLLWIGGCTTQPHAGRGISVAPYSLEALDYAYGQKVASHE